MSACDCINSARVTCTDPINRWASYSLPKSAKKGPIWSLRGLLGRYVCTKAAFSSTSSSSSLLTLVTDIESSLLEKRKELEDGEVDNDEGVGVVLLSCLVWRHPSVRGRDHLFTRSEKGRDSSRIVDKLISACACELNTALVIAVIILEGAAGDTSKSPVSTRDTA